MTNIRHRFSLLTCLLILFMLAACKKDPEVVISTPVLTTTAISSVTSDKAVTGGIISSDGGAPVSQRGVCWSTSPNPTTSNSTAFDGSTGTGSFTTNMSNLSGNTTYYVRAYAVNEAGTAYGNELSFKNITPLRHPCYRC